MKYTYQPEKIHTQIRTRTVKPRPSPANIAMHFLLQAQKLFDFYISNISSAFFSKSFASSFTFYDDSNKASVVSIFLPIF